MTTAAYGPFQWTQIICMSMREDSFSKVNTGGDCNSEACKPPVFIHCKTPDARLLACLHGYFCLLKCRMPLSFLNTHPKPAILPFSAVNKCTTEADNTYRRPRFACDARNALLPLMAHGPWVSWDPWSSSCPIGSLSTFWTQFSSFSWL